MVNLFKFLFVLLSLVASEEDVSSDDSTTAAEAAANVIFIMIDDLGRSDISLFGAEWETANFDSFISESITLSHHYIGYVCSASRSQFLTGRYSYHNGYGTLNVFDVARLGAIPQHTPTIMEYLKEFGNYATYGIGKWQLGSAVSTQLGINRGFDSFIGFNGGIEDYFSKSREEAVLDKTLTYIDFMEGDQVSDKLSDGYSTDQYFDEIINIINDKAAANTVDTINDEAFFIYAGLQANHIPFPDHVDDTTWTQYYQECMDKYFDKIENFEYRIGVCESMLGIDYGMGKLIKHFKNTQSEKLKAIWENTIIIVTADNGGALDSGSCNYPLRGGKNTFFEGGQRVLTFVGGGKLPDSRRGVTLDGLISNVDWFPTILSMANLIPNDMLHAKFEETIETSETEEVRDSKLVTLMLDGYNMYNYLFSDKYDNAPIRDHLVLHMLPRLANDNYFLNFEETTEASSSIKSDRESRLSDISTYEYSDMEELAIVFYDDNGKLWKYLDVSDSLNPIGTPLENSGWCVFNEFGDFGIDLGENDNPLVNYGLFAIDDDTSELTNYFDDENKSRLKSMVNMEDIYQIINEKIKYYVNSDNDGSQNSQFLYGNFECFTSDVTDQITLYEVVEENEAWVPFWTEKEFGTAIAQDCGLEESHPIYQLLTTKFKWPSDVTIVDNSDAVTKINSRSPVFGSAVFGAKMHENVVMNSDKSLVSSANNSVFLIVLIGIIGLVSVYGYIQYKKLNKKQEYQQIGP